MPAENALKQAIRDLIREVLAEGLSNPEERNGDQSGNRERSSRQRGSVTDPAHDRRLKRNREDEDQAA